MKSNTSRSAGLRALAIGVSTALFATAVLRAQSGCASVDPVDAPIQAEPPTPAPVATQPLATEPGASAAELAPAAPNESANAADPEPPMFFPGSKSGGFLPPPSVAPPPANAPVKEPAAP